MTMNKKNNLTYDDYVIYGCICLLALFGILYISDVSLWDWRVKICCCIILVCLVIAIYYKWNSSLLLSGCICLLALFGILYISDVSLWDWRVKICCCIILVCLVIAIYYKWNSSLLLSVKVHVLVAGETFQAHETFMQKLNLQREPCSAESSNVVLVFCPVVSRIGTDMEAAMARVTEDKPVILVFMHHCHNPSHMTNITVQPSRGNIMQVVHCIFLENGGLLQCKENNQAVSEVRGMLQNYQQRKRPSTEEIFKSV